MLQRLPGWSVDLNTNIEEEPCHAPLRFLVLLTVILLVPALASADVSEGLKAYQANEREDRIAPLEACGGPGGPGGPLLGSGISAEGRGVPQDFEGRVVATLRLAGQ